MSPVDCGPFPIREICFVGTIGNCDNRFNSIIEKSGKNTCKYTRLARKTRGEPATCPARAPNHCRAAASSLGGVFSRRATNTAGSGRSLIFNFVSASPLRLE